MNWKEIKLFLYQSEHTFGRQCRKAIQTIIESKSRRVPKSKAD